jgi:hypothetical protein
MRLVYNPKKYNKFFLWSTILKYNLLLNDNLKGKKKISGWLRVKLKKNRQKKTSYTVYFSSE